VLSTDTLALSGAKVNGCRSEELCSLERAWRRGESEEPNQWIDSATHLIYHALFIDRANRVSR